MLSQVIDFCEHKASHPSDAIVVKDAAEAFNPKTIAFTAYEKTFSAPLDGNMKCSITVAANYLNIPDLL